MYIFLSQHNDRLKYTEYMYVLNMKGLKGGRGMQTDTENRKADSYVLKRSGCYIFHLISNTLKIKLN